MPSESPDKQHRDSPDQQSGPWRRLLTGQLPLETETTQFILVNVLDFFMTYWLLQTGRFRESNPIAEYFLASWGPVKGMLLFKLALVTFVCLIAQIIAIWNLDRARWLLRFGTAVVAIVVIYSFTLLIRN
jgi:hypothetical protein